MIVDGEHINVQGASVDYFEEHYKKLGYDVFLTGNGKKNYNEEKGE